MFENIMRIVTSFIFVSFGLYAMIKHKKLSEAFLASDRAFREVMGWRAHKNSELILKLQSFFLLFFGLIFALVGVVTLFNRGK